MSKAKWLETEDQCPSNFLEALGPTMVCISHSCWQWYKKRQMLQQRKKCSHSFICCRPLAISHWHGQTMRFSEEDAQISRVNGLPRSPSAVMVYSEVLLHFPENCSTPKLTSFNVLRGVPNLIRITGKILKTLFNIVLVFLNRSSNKSKSREPDRWPWRELNPIPPAFS